MIAVLFERLTLNSDLGLEAEDNWDRYQVTTDDYDVADILTNPNNYKVIEAIPVWDWDVINFWDYQTSKYGISTHGTYNEALEALDLLKSILRDDNGELTDYKNSALN